MSVIKEDANEEIEKRRGIRRKHRLEENDFGYF